jgi:hypothetical protein
MKKIKSHSFFPELLVNFEFDLLLGVQTVRNPTALVQLTASIIQKNLVFSEFVLLLLL